MQDRNRLLASVALATFTPAVLFLVVPNSAILPNLQEISYDRTLALGMVVSFLVAWTLCLGLYFNAPRFRMCERLGRTTILIGIAVFLWNTLSIAADRIDNLALLAGFDVVVIAVSAGIAFAMGARQLTTLFTVVGLLLTVSGSAEHLWKTREFWQPSLASTQASLFPTNASRPVARPVVLDGLQAASNATEIIALQEGHEVRTPSDRYAYAAEFPFADGGLATEPTYVELKALVTKGAIHVGVLSPGRARWLDNSASPVQASESVVHMKVPLPVGKELGSLMISNAAEAGVQSVVQILEASVHKENVLVEQEPAHRSSVMQAQGNVYHIIADAYQTEAYAYLLRNSPELLESSGTYYPSFRTNSARTFWSMSELLWGRLYERDIPVDEWYLNSFQHGLFDKLFKGGVNLHLFPHYRYYCHRSAKVCETNLDLKSAELSKHTIIDLWFLKVIPYTAKAILNRWALGDVQLDTVRAHWNYGFSLMEALFAMGEPPTDSDNPYFSARQFQKVIDSEPSRPPRGQYVFVHSILPHPPNVLDEQCSFIPKSQRKTGGQRAYLDQVKCMHRLLNGLFSRLKELDRFDDSLIVVHGDHGNYVHSSQMVGLRENATAGSYTFNIDTDDSWTWESDTVEIRASALLWIKYPGQSHFTASDLPVQMIDIAPTVMDYFKFTYPSASSVPVYDLPRDARRKQLFFATNVIPRLDKPEWVSVYERTDGEWVFREKFRPPQ